MVCLLPLLIYLKLYNWTTSTQCRIFSLNSGGVLSSDWINDPEKTGLRRRLTIRRPNYSTYLQYVITCRVPPFYRPRRRMHPIVANACGPYLLNLSTAIFLLYWILNSANSASCIFCVKQRALCFSITRRPRTSLCISSVTKLWGTGRERVQALTLRPPKALTLRPPNYST
jgi:hypothetical protein